MWRAIDENVGRDVAVKTLRARSAGGGGRAGFGLVYASVAALSNPGIAQVHHYGEEPATDGRPAIPYLVRDLVSGPTLEERLAGGSLPAAEALRYVASVADALAAAHGAGVVHGNLVPSNIINGPAGVQVTDFGLAALREYPPDERFQSVLSYAAPERLGGEPATTASDMYSLGVLFVACPQRHRRGRDIRLSAGRRIQPPTRSRLAWPRCGLPAWAPARGKGPVRRTSPSCPARPSGGPPQPSPPPAAARAEEEPARAARAEPGRSAGGRPPGAAGRGAPGAPHRCPSGQRRTGAGRRTRRGGRQERRAAAEPCRAAGVASPGRAPARRDRPRNPARLPGTGGHRCGPPGRAGARHLRGGGGRGSRRGRGAHPVPHLARGPDHRRARHPLVHVTATRPAGAPRPTGKPLPSAEATSSVLASATPPPLQVLDQIQATIRRGVASGQIRQDVGVDLTNLLQPVQGDLAAGNTAGAAQLVGGLKAKLTTRLGEGAITPAAGRAQRRACHPAPERDRAG